MATLITGAGLVGSVAAARLANHAGPVVLYDVGFSMDNLRDRLPLDRVTLVRGDVADVGDLVRTIQEHGVTRIIHTAGFLTSFVRERPIAGVRTNLNGTLNVFEAARLTGVKRVVFCSSNTVYTGLRGAPPGGLNVEDFSLKAVSEAPASVYAAMKLAGEWLGQCYTREYGVEVISVRFGGVFGPWRGLPSGGPTRLLQQIVENTWRGEPVRIGSGDLKRGGMDYAYASDAAQGAVLASLRDGGGSSSYNISMGELFTVPQIVDIVERLSERKTRLDVQDSGSFGGYDSKNFPADLTLARKELGYQVEFPMEAAIRDYLDWLQR
ncbi:MAG: NAD(P)-dependent oxidoreductase [Chloroflexi bacterium]|nr:NAD(P)-dependent oxidoreductase [Chloroflexota bacterium]